MGDFRDNLFHGYGVAKSSDGTILFQGQWKNDVLLIFIYSVNVLKNINKGEFHENHFIINYSIYLLYREQ